MAREDEVVLVDTLDGEAIEVPASAVMVRSVAPAANPVWDIGALSDTEFSARQAMLKKGVQRIAELQRSILVEDTEGKGRNGDWGKIPGVDRAIIYKSGAEKLCQFYRLVPQFRVSRDESEATDLGFPSEATRPNRITYTVETLMHAGSIDGPVVGNGQGVCSSWEKKYLFRTGGRVCPSCGKATLRLGDKRGAAEGTKEWYCWKKEGKSDGCGDRFAFDDPSIGGSPDVMNMEPWDLENTLIKIATKRSHVDATLRTLAASALFTQDVEENPPPPEEHVERPNPEPAPFRPLRGPEVPGDGQPEPPRVLPKAGMTQCESRSPYDHPENEEAQQCRREQGHTGAHRTTNESWT